MDKAAEIAGKLTAAQRAAVMATRGPDDDGLFWFPLGRARGIHVDLKQRTVTGHCLTPLGLAVRAHLQEQQR